MPRHDVDPFTQRLILHKAWRLVGRAGFTPQDVADLVQELTLRFFHRHPGLDPGDPRHHAFVTAVVNQCVAGFLRERHAQKRRRTGTGSLDVLVNVGDGAPVPLAETICRRERDRRVGDCPRDEDDLARMRLDVADVVAALPPDLRDLAERLQRRSVAEVARELGVARTSLYRLVRRLRRRFEKAGLKGYVQEFPSSRSCSG